MKLQLSNTETMKRQRAVPREGGSPSWRSSPTALGAPLDAMFRFNRAAVRDWIEERAGSSAVAPARAVARVA